MTFEQLVRSFPQWAKKAEIKKMTFYSYIEQNCKDIKKAFENKDISLYLSVLKKSAFDNKDEANLEGLLRAGMAYFEYMNKLN